MRNKNPRCDDKVNARGVTKVDTQMYTCSRKT